MKFLISTVAVASFLFPASYSPTPATTCPQETSEAEAEKDRAAVLQAGWDYLEALYEVKPERIERSVHRELRKFGFYRPKGGDKYGTHPMTYEELVRLAGSWNKAGSKANDQSLKRVEILDLMDTTAAIKVHATWGVDHMQLGKFDGTWKILNILWQSHPE